MGVDQLLVDPVTTAFGKLLNVQFARGEHHLTKRAVENRVTSFVFKIAEDNRILLRQLGSPRRFAMQKRPGRHSAQQEDYDSRGCAERGRLVPAEELARSVQPARR